MIKGGKGGAKTQSGLMFEERVDLRTAFSNLPNYQVIGNEIVYNGRVVAKIYKKYEFYNKFLRSLNIRCNLSQKLVPDDTIFVEDSKALFVIEIKFQSGSGSVDEKLQTCDFKKKQYQKLLKDTGIKVEYVYILNSWFKALRYRDVLEYIESVGCKYFFKILPLKVLGMPEPKAV